MSLSYGLCALAPAPWRAAGAGGGGGMRRNFPDSDLQRRLWRSRGFARRGRLVKSRPGDGIAKGVAFALWKQVSKTPRKLSSKSHGLETLESSERELNAPPRNVAIKSAVDERDGLDQCTPDFEPPSEQQRLGSDFNTLVKRFWRVALPYWSSEDKVEARWRLGTVLALTLATTGISVGFNFLGRDFYNALSSKDQEQFLKQLLYYLGAFVGGIPVFVIRDYSRDTLALRWRAWITQHYMARYFENRTFYNIQSQSLIDNPDQRIVDDLNSFTTTSLVFALAIFNAVIDLISFSGILYGIYPPLFGVLIVYSIGGTALSVALGKGLVGLNFMQEKREADFRYGLVRVRENAESIAFYAGESSEINLLLERFNQSFANYSQLLIASRNLDFFTSAYRYLIQLLPAAVVAPLYFAGKIEFGVINQSFSAFNHILSDFSIIVYQFQSISSFSAVVDRLGEFSEILDQQNTLSRPVTYLGSASEAIESSQTEGGSSLRPRISILDRRETIQPVLNGQNESSRKVPLLMMEHLTLNTPQYTSKLVEDLSVVVNQGEHLLIMGASGSGKTSLLRAIAGLWAAGTGTITRFLRSESEGVDRVSRPDNSEAIPGDTANHAVNGAVTSSSLDISQEIFFLPQRPYMVLGTLRQQILYPIWTERGFTSPLSPKSNGPVTSSAYTDATPVGLKPQPSDEELTDVLERVSLGHLMSSCDGLDANVEWASVLSLGEQQRLAFARLLISKPRLALMDESTSALDEENEMLLYGEIKKSGITYISVGHRTTLKQFHSNILKISKLDGGGCNWTFGPLDRKPDLEVMGSPN
ncbi:vitamin B12/bleomycin/antimicrobial peptide transport system ATP-binding/permease protein [Marchantia polymorpha subsp. ruderalis]|uniref:ABC transporter domain-containing protein n=1 Tax=Marchantia polymorpha TaxID=3197 RepID=A0A2R6WGD5_MARPO|nr:hypothetical protein MARPO_0094s0070 [Marchantia polymorpha]BBN02774.1 hypothetical protein Mp_2g18020 [Marchantia polymorpha subsp. ruderalis]|eukprot:PTQ32901.1 hypothetical protein MARPO_0094s0070 [Marchantia polymorpha]